MFRDVPGCSGMFRDVPCSGFYRRPNNVASVCTIVSPSNFTPEERERFPSKRFQNVIRLLAINKDNPGGNLVQKHKTIKFNVVGEQPATKYPQISITDLKE